MRLLFLASWVILLVVSVLIALASAASLYQGYSKTDETIAGAYSTAELRQQGGEEAFIALKARRVTAATWALAYALLAILVVVVPYRRGEKWAWWALIIAVGVSQILSMARAVTLMTTAGAGTAGVLLAFVLIGLMAGAPKMFANRPSSSTDL
jgi:peptidoglycan/LPS O-acetylase OafA/YrhL